MRKRDLARSRRSSPTSRRETKLWKLLRRR
jgi:hypothetical protein